MSPLTFVCCVESGYLESQTVRLVQSLRKFGGRFANIPVIAVTPRFGAPLSKSTQSLFANCNVKHVRTPSAREYSWFNFFNKPLALVAAEQYVETESVCFLDSDLLVVRDPYELELAATEDLAAFPVECKEMGTAGPGDPFEEFWRASCKVVGLRLEALPWITTAETRERVRLYFNGGIFVYRRDSGFAGEYLRICKSLLDSGISTRNKGYSLGFKEMVSVGFAAMTLGLRWRPLSYSHNFVMASFTHEQWYSLQALKEARIVHYHDAMWPSFWPVFLGCMRDAHPDVASWLSSLGPMRNESPLAFRVLTRFLRSMRTREAARYSAHCRDFY